VGPPVIDFERGELRIRGWPDDGPRAPFGLQANGSELRGPARLHHALRAALASAGVAFLDRALPPIVPALPAPDLRRTGATVAGLFGAWARAGRRGLLCGIELEDRWDMVQLAALSGDGPTLLVTGDSAAVDVWGQALHERGLDVGFHPQRGCRVAVATAAAAARDVARIGDGHALLCVDQPELIPSTQFRALTDGSAACARLGLTADASPRGLLRWTEGLGPFIGQRERGSAPSQVELRVALPRAARERYDAAWHDFLCAYDRFAAMQPGGGFGRFVAQARSDPEMRPGLLGWHAALAAAAWNDGKAEIVAELLRRHDGERILVFTPDRRSAYDIAQAHLIPAVTAELPRRERRQAIAAFVAGGLRALAGPRLLDAGLPDGTADVGILVGGGFSAAQRRARLRRVHFEGIVYELVGLDTVEVGRGRRWRGTAADATVVVHGR
jgi:hypothetical protein